ncbi:MAG: hypothetical protein BBJ57_10475 [Desulfobacterales bacterium PC51MH44]|nr:MAG: hypothetical protein BBJ57_10475 [Desulfobacterales bacterium PC51MH44]
MKRRNNGTLISGKRKSDSQNYHIAKCLKKIYVPEKWGFNLKSGKDEIRIRNNIIKLEFRNPVPIARYHNTLWQLLKAFGMTFTDPCKSLITFQIKNSYYCISDKFLYIKSIFRFC